MRTATLVLVGVMFFGCGSHGPRVQPVVPIGETAERSLVPSDPYVEATQVVAERIAARERRFRDLYDPGSFWRGLRVEQDDIDAGRVPLSRLVEIGKDLFSNDFGPEQGLGNGLAALGSPLAGKRPAPNLRHVHYKDFGGPDGTRCIGCHHFGGQGGSGTRTDNVFLDGDGDRPASGLERNPRALLGAALLQRLGEEMTDELYAQVKLAKKTMAPGKSAPLTAKGVQFGVVRVNRNGQLDLTGVRGVSLDLVVRPFGWKGTATSLRQVILTALQQNLGIQAEELVSRAARGGTIGSGPADDPDADGVKREATVGMVTALTSYLASLAPPIEDLTMDPTYSLSLGKGQHLFEKIGCASCHIPELPLENTVIGLGPNARSQPQVDLAPLLGTAKSHRVRLYSDLRRHSMGDVLAEERGYLGIPKQQWLTPPLWGISTTAPYLHDGRAGNVHEAILLHGGEASAAQAAYAKLSVEEGAPLRLFLFSLSRPSHLEFKP